jgi:hypothetical protein
MTPFITHVLASPDGYRTRGLLIRASPKRVSDLARHIRLLAGVPPEGLTESPPTGSLSSGGFLHTEDPHHLTPCGVMLLHYRKYGFLADHAVRALALHVRGVEFDAELAEDAIQAIHANFRGSAAASVDMSGVEDVIVEV